MGEITKIAWCDHTFNPWIGCTAVSAGCEYCYAERENKRRAWVQGWGEGAPRRRTSEANWKKPLEWARQAVKDGVTRRVFCASLADVFDTEIDPYWRFALLDLIRETGKIGGLEWLLLTKRIEHAYRELPVPWLENPPDFVRLGVTAENQAMWDLRVARLLGVWHGKNFISVEPMLGPVDPDGPFGIQGPENGDWGNPVEPDGWLENIDWVICGGETGPDARPMHPDWARSLRDHCTAAKVPFFFKSWGDWYPAAAQYGDPGFIDKMTFGRHCICLGNRGTVFQEEWGDREEYWCGHQPDPDQNPWFMEHVGARRSGHLLDGVEWHQFPTPESAK